MNANQGDAGGKHFADRRQLADYSM